MEEQIEYDREIISKKRNKDGQRLVLKRKISNNEIITGSGYYGNVGEYDIFLETGEYVGFISAAVCNYKDGDTAEIEYGADEGHRNKGNIGIGVKEVLKDIFVEESLDGFQIRPNGKPSKITRVFLAINADNFTSLAVARKNSFKQDEKFKNIHVITKEEFLELLRIEAAKENADREDIER